MIPEPDLEARSGGRMDGRRSFGGREWWGGGGEGIVKGIRASGNGMGGDGREGMRRARKEEEMGDG